MTSTLRPFETTDWFCYSGCESTDPMIARTECGDLILDDDMLIFHPFDEAFAPFCREVHSSVEAEVIAAAVVGDPMPELLNSLGFYSTASLERA